MNNNQNNTDYEDTLKELSKAIEDSKRLREQAEVSLKKIFKNQYRSTSPTSKTKKK